MIQGRWKWEMKGTQKNSYEPTKSKGGTVVLSASKFLADKEAHFTTETEF